MNFLVIWTIIEYPFSQHLLLLVRLLAISANIINFLISIYKPYYFTFLLIGYLSCFIIIFGTRILQNNSSWSITVKDVNIFAQLIGTIIGDITLDPGEFSKVGEHPGVI